MTFASVSLLHCLIDSGWYTVLEFVASGAMLLIYDLFHVKQDGAPSKADFEEMKKVVADLGREIKGTTNKLTGYRMTLGLKD